MISIFWSCLIIILYTYVGYGVLLYLLVKFRRLIKGRRLIPRDLNNLPSMTLIVAAYNEEAFIEKKSRTLFRLNILPENAPIFLSLMVLTIIQRQSFPVIHK